MSFTVYKFNPYIDLPGRKVKRVKRHRHYYYSSVNEVQVIKLS